MKGIRCKTRREWIHGAIGSGGNFTAIKMGRVIQLRQLDGWRTAMPAAGPSFEPVAFVHDSSPLSALVRAYNDGQRWFEIDAIERAIGCRLCSPVGVIRLSQAGLGLLRHDPAKRRVELAAAGPKEALYVNKARAGGGMGGNIRRVVDAFLHLTIDSRPGFNLTDRRCRRVAKLMRDKWGIRCKGLLSRQSRVRFISNWLLPGIPAGPPVRFKSQRVLCLGRRTLPDGTQKCGVWWEEQEFGM